MNTLSKLPTTQACTCDADCISAYGDSVQIGVVTVTRFYCDDCGGFTSETVTHEVARKFFCGRQRTDAGVRYGWGDFTDGEDIANVIQF